MTALNETERLELQGGETLHEIMRHTGLIETEHLEVDGGETPHEIRLLKSLLGGGADLWRRHLLEATLEGRKAWLDDDFCECLEHGDALAKAIDIKVAGLGED